jgi:predicted O-methyltransferase YrrM
MSSSASQTNEHLWPAVYAEAIALLQLVQEITPKNEIEIRTAHGYILGMFWRSRRLFEGAIILLAAELPEESAFLARSLFEESLHLKQIADEREHRDALRAC